jgi:hypothetical protein
LWYEGIKIWRDEILEKAFSNVSAKAEIAMLIDSKNENKWLKYEYIVTCMVAHATNKTGSSSNDWIY